MIEINEADKPKVTRTIVVYSGRFQPFHRGHYDAYKRLVSKFGANNVYIGTSNVTDNTKSPFNFKDKKEIATKMFGIPSNRFVRLSNPYAPEEILNKYDGKTTQYIAAVGGKDADRLSGQYFKPYKGKAGYGYDEIGYVYTIPPEEDPISGTEVRKGLGGKDKEKAKKFFLRAYPKFDKEIFDLITSKLKKMISEYGTLRGVGQAQSFDNYKADTERELDIDDDDKTKNEDGFPGGIGVGLTLPGGYINGAPTGSTNETVNTNPSPKLRPEPHPTRHETEHPSDEPDWYNKEEPYTNPQNELYDPIAQIIENSITDEDFENFVKSYFYEKEENPIFKKDIIYTNSKGKKKKIKVKDALHLPKDHPAHKQAKELIGDEPIPTPKSKKKEKPGTEKKPEQQPSKKGGEAGKEQGPPPEQKLTGAELKNDAEKRQDTEKQQHKDAQLKDNSKKPAHELSDEEAHEQIKHEMHDLSHEDKKAYELLDGIPPEEKARVIDEALNNRSWWEKFKQDTVLGGWISKKGKQLKDTANGVKSFVKGGKIGITEDCSGAPPGPHAKKSKGNVSEDSAARQAYLSNLGPDGKPKQKAPVDKSKCKDVHFSDYQKRDEKGEPIFKKEPVPVYETGKKPDPKAFGTDGKYHSGLSDGYIGPGGVNVGKKEAFHVDELDTKTGYFKRDGKYYDKTGHNVDENGNKLDKDGKPKQDTDWRGRPKTRKVKTPVYEDGLTPEQLHAAHESHHAAHEQKHALIHTGIEVGAIVGGVCMGPLLHYTFGVGAGGSHSIPEIAKHVLKDAAQHSFMDMVGIEAAPAAGAGVGYSALHALAEGINEGNTENHKKFVIDLMRKIMDRMKTYKMTPQQKLQSIRNYKRKQKIQKEKEKRKDLEDLANTLNEHYVSSTGMFSRKLTPQQKIDKLNPARAKEKSRIWHQTFAHHNPDTGETEDDENLKERDIKVKNINDFVQYATEKLKLKESPKVTLINSEQYGTTKSSLGGYDPQTKQIYVQSKGRLSADIIRTIAHEMVHRKQDELGLIKNVEEDGATGSPIENQANAIAGILLRNYGKRNKKIYTENKQYENSENKEMISGIIDMLCQVEDLNNRKRMAIDRLRDFKKDNIKVDAKDFLNKIGLGEDITVNVDKGDEVLMGKFKNKKVKIKNIGKDDHGMPTINGRQATTFRTLNEVSDLGSGGDDQPNGAWLPKNSIRELGANDGVNKSDNWYINGGYTQTDFPIADAIFDDDTIQTVVKYSVDNAPRTDFEKTKFNKAEDKISMNEYQKLAQQVLRELFVDNINEVSNIDASYGEDQSFRSPYLPDWDGFDLNGQNYADIVGYEMIGHDSTHHIAKTKGSILPVNNPTEENGEGKRTIHPSKGEEYAKEKKDKWEMYPFNTRQYTFGGPDVYSNPFKNPVKGLNESILLNEGGAYGHMSHPFEDMDLTFGDLKNMINGALDGELGIVREKTDGQALAISWKNGRLIAARNKSHLENAGVGAMGIEDVASKFGGRGALTDAYNFAMKDLSAAVASLSQSQREKIFHEGKCFMNLEVIWPQNSNVIPYGQALLVFHNAVCYDQKGNAVGADQGAARTLAGMIKQVNADVQSKYTIQGPPITELPKNQNLSSKKGQYLSKLNRLKSEFRCSDSDTLSVYHQNWWENFIDKNAPVKVDKLTKAALIKRWAFGDKSFRLKTISNLELQEWATKNDKVNVVKQQKENMQKFEEIFLGVGADVLQFMSSVLTVHPEKAVRAMKGEFETVAKQVRAANNPSLIGKLKDEMSRLNSLGGIKKIVPIEGIVFFYNGKTYKLTGSFAALNQILGLLKFSR